MDKDLRALLKDLETILITHPKVSIQDPFDVEVEYCPTYQIGTVIPKEIIYKGTKVKIEFYFYEEDRGPRREVIDWKKKNLARLKKKE